MRPREQFAATATQLLDERADVAVVYAEISGQLLGAATQAHPDRVINVGIREQLLIGASAGLALTGIRPIAHTFAPFLVSRAYEQIKLSFAHQDVGGVLVSYGGSYDVAPGGRTHQGPEDVALMLTIPHVTVHVPGTCDEVDRAIRIAAADDGLHYVRVSDDSNAASYSPGVHRVRDSASDLTLVVFGPLLDAATSAAEDLDASVVYVNRLADVDASALRSAVATTDVALIEPWYEGTALHWVQSQLTDAPRRFTSIGVPRREFRHYGTPAQHRAAHGLDATGIRRRLGSPSRAGRD